MPELVCAADDPRWLTERQRGITATDITAIIGLSSYQSPYGLYWAKKGVTKRQPDNDRLRLGRDLEPIIMQRWLESAASGREVIDAWNGTLYRSTERPWQLATPDRVIWHSSGQAMPEASLELKSWADMDRDSWGPDDTDQIPPQVRTQLLWQMDTLDVSRGHVGVLFLPSGEFRSYTIEHTPDCVRPIVHPASDLVPGCGMCDDLILMRLAGAAFFERMKPGGEPPDVDGSAATLAALKARFAAPAESPAADIDPANWDGMTCHRQLAKDHEAAAREFEALIRKQAGNSARLKVNGSVVGRRVTVDAKVKEHVRHQDYIRVLAAKESVNGD